MPRHHDAASPSSYLITCFCIHIISVLIPVSRFNFTRGSEGPTEFFDADADRFNHELRTIVTLQEEEMLFGVFLRQKKGLPHFSIIEIGKIDTAIVTIFASACQHHPMSVARPGGVAVGIVTTIDRGKVESRGWIKETGLVQ